MPGNRPELNGGVILGGRRLQVTVSRENAENLKGLSIVMQTTVHGAAEQLLNWAIQKASMEYMTGVVVGQTLVRVLM